MPARARGRAIGYSGSRLHAMHICGTVVCFIGVLFLSTGWNNQPQIEAIGEIKTPLTRETENSFMTDMSNQNGLTTEEAKRRQ